MSKVYVIYWSQTGNTLAMANAIGAGIEEAGAQADVLEVGSANIGDIKDAAGFALGCPAMGAEELEDSEMEPFVSEVEKIAAGKTIALFGSYGLGRRRMDENMGRQNEGSRSQCYRRGECNLPGDAGRCRS